METIMLQFTRRIPPLVMATILRMGDMSVDSQFSGMVVIEFQQSRMAHKQYSVSEWCDATGLEIVRLALAAYLETGRVL
jgi:predicted TPR repeat methyltransferase